MQFLIVKIYEKDFKVKLPTMLSTYVDLTTNHAQHLVIGTFSETGPLKCSGLEIKQYTEQAMSKTFEPNFQKIECVNSVHATPFDTTQDFIFCRFQRNTY